MNYGIVLQKYIYFSMLAPKPMKYLRIL